MSNWLTDAIAKESAYDEGFEAGRQSVAEEIFEELDQRILDTHSDGYLRERIRKEIAKLKKKYGIKEPQHNPVASGYYVEPKGESIGGVLVEPTDTWNISGYRVEED